MKYFVLAALLFTVSVSGIIIAGCSEPSIRNQPITDLGTASVGDGIYLKKLSVGRGSMAHEDRVYLLVDENGRVVAGTTTSYTVNNGKTTRVQSNTVIVR